MAKPLFIEIDGKRYAWKALEEMKRAQIAARTKAVQPTLFELVEDSRPSAERHAADRYSEPGLFS